MAWTPERKREVQDLLRATARHLEAKERGEDSHLITDVKISKLDGDGKVISSWKTFGPITMSFSTSLVDPEVMAALIGEGVCD